MPEPQLKTENRKIRDIIHAVRTGRLRVPEFQRGYVWGKTKNGKPPKNQKAPLLLDSLYHNLPISTLLVWLTGESVQDRYLSKSSECEWLVDGQQRVMTLYRIGEQDENLNIDVVFHPETGKFDLASKKTTGSDWFHVSKIWDENEFRDIRSEVNRNTEIALERVNKILDYEIPVVMMMNHPFDKATEAFDRINRLGVKLTGMDLKSVQVAAKHQKFITKHVIPFVDKMHDQGFDRLNQAHFFHVCNFITKKEPEDCDTSTLEKAWGRMESAMNKAVNFFGQQFGQQDMKNLPYAHLFVPTMVLFDKWSAKDKKPDELAGWIALATLNHRYSSQSNTRLEQDLHACRDIDPIRALLRVIKQSQPSGLYAQDFDFITSTTKDKGVLFAAYLACRYKGMCDLYTKEKLLIDKDLHRHHIFPKSSFGKDRSQMDTIANIAFISDTTNKAINDDMPAIYLSKLPNKILESQCIPEDKTLWDKTNYEDFLAVRAKLLVNAFNEYIKEKLPDRRFE